jgi:hypothetical protein
MGGGNLGGGSLKSKLIDWIDAIPDNKLDGAFVTGRPVYIDQYCRLDLQNITADGLSFNLQVQVNSQCPDTTMSLLKPKSVAWCHAPIEDQWTPAQIKAFLKSTVTGREVKVLRVEPPPPVVKAPPAGNKNKARKR